MNFSERVLRLTARIPPGKVSTYAEIARALGKPGATRAVGNALAANESPDEIPCYRVVHSDGSVKGYSGPGGTREKIRRLERDDIDVRKGRINLEKHIFRFKRKR